MLRPDYVVRAREFLAQLRTGEVPMPEKLGEYIYVLNFALEHMDRYSNMRSSLRPLCGQPEILCDIQSKLAEISGLNPWGGLYLVLTEGVGEYCSSILSEDFWNDLEPYWFYPGARYGDSPGDDVLIRLIGYAMWDRT